MKKIILIASFVLAFAGLNFAQTTPAASTKKTPPAKTAVAPKPAPAATGTAAGPKKKDGTADMRYKANKDAAKAPPVHTKKDGSADMRYKENKPKKTS
jgi:hypothetical protein